MNKTPLILLLAALLPACDPIPEGYIHPAAPDVPIVASAPPRAPDQPPPETLVVPAAQAQKSGLPAARSYLAFGPDQDGTKLLADFLQKAHARGARYASDIAFYFVTEKDGRKTECRVGVAPEDEIQTVAVPGRTEGVSQMVPVTKNVTEMQYRCRLTSKMVTGPETHMENRCRMVSKPYTRTETTYTMQYDAFSKTTRSVPQTRTVTDYRLENECRMESVTKTVTKSQMVNECGMESVTHTVTRYEFQYQTRFIPPHFASITTKKLRETEPVCRALSEGEESRGNRLEGALYGVGR